MNTTTSLTVTTANSTSANSLSAHKAPVVSHMNGLQAIVQRELHHYFGTPLAYIFLSIFLMFSGVCTFYLGRLFESGQADMQPFFIYHPWLYLFLVPALSMRLWAEERKSGTVELLLTFPVSVTALVLGKFLAAWLFIGTALLFTLPLWLTMNYLGDPDNGVILAGYLGSWVMAGSFLAIGSCLSAVSKNQILAFVLTFSIAFVFVVAGFPIVVEWAAGLLPEYLVDFVANLSIYTHFIAITKGVLDIRDFAYFLISTLAWLYATCVIVEGYRN